MDSKKKARCENNNTSLPVQIEWCGKLINEVNYEYRLFTQATMNNKEELNKAGILKVEKIEKTGKIPTTSGLEWHHVGESSHDVYKTYHPSSESRCYFLHQKENSVKLIIIHQN